MIVIGALLNIVELGLFGWMLFTLAIYALPAFVGLTRRSIQFKLEQDPFGAIIVGFVADGTTLVSGQCAVSVVAFALSAQSLDCYWRLLRHVRSMM